MKTEKKWTAKDIPDQTGRKAIVTGANTGIGFETAKALAVAGAEVTLACRSATKGEDALNRIRKDLPKANVSLRTLDLSDLDSVREFAVQYAAGNDRADNDRLDLLINNAGVMVPPESKTKQGFELQFGVNHLGHYALTGLLLDLLRANAGARVVNVSSAAHHMGKMDFDDLNFFGRGYKPWEAYGQSKLANLLFTFELQRRFEADGLDIIATAAHPGWTGTDLQRNAWYVRLMNVAIAMSPPQGALPTLRAATDPHVKGGEYFGPHGIREMRGYPVEVDTSEDARSMEDAARLWQVSEELTGVSYDLSAAHPAPA
jgi:NAD(P)-dependent dehydrogenase (short-subunit alcohol dehydrogenase family)